MATHSGILAQRIPWTEEPNGLYSQQKKKDPELTVVQIMNSLLPNSDLN